MIARMSVIRGTFEAARMEHVLDTGLALGSTPFQYSTLVHDKIPASHSSLHIVLYHYHIMMGYTELPENSQDLQIALPAAH